MKKWKVRIFQGKIRIFTFSLLHFSLPKLPGDKKVMPNILWAVARENKIELLEDADIPEGTKVLVVILSDNEQPHLRHNISLTPLDMVWNNTEDDVYAKLLQE